MCVYICVCKRGVSCAGIHVHPEDEGGRGFILVRERTRTSRMCKKEGKTPKTADGDPFCIPLVVDVGTAELNTHTFSL